MIIPSILIEVALLIEGEVIPDSLKNSSLIIFSYLQYSTKPMNN